ncbi:MAG: acyl-CoA/acyl-ACP dehydrogenase [Syntrophaceae bacterium]|nr:acyl-CoA/acyl-ACP dehydrogenase [Syntrophaceae bacterium]
MSGIRLTRKERARYLAQDPRLNEVINSLMALRRFPKSKAINKQIDTAVAIARKFNEEVVEPVYKQIDLEVSRDDNYLCWDFVKKANEWGLFTLFVPKMFGGAGMNMIGMYPFIEEIASVCTGLSNVIGVHYLGFATLGSSWNLKLMNEIMKDVKKGEKTGDPCLITLANTEPEAGTDLEEVMLFDRAKIGTEARKVKGGYIVNGSKVFISNGHVSKWHMLSCFGDKTKPSETSVMLAIRNGMKGFRLGHHEKKMGQKACVASELIFEDCFVPDKYVCMQWTDLPAGFSRKSVAEFAQHVIDYIVSSTRAGVGAFAVGAARGAYETALEYARKKTVNGKLLINHQWAQSMLAEMYKNVNMGRAIVMESAYANALHGLAKMLFLRPFYYMNLYLPSWYFRMISPMINMKVATLLTRFFNLYLYPKKSAEIQSGWASLTKVGCTDIGIINSQMALQLMGIDGCRHDIGSEKYYRDAKLLQIYEGTNQLNRINLFKNLVGRNMKEVEVF